MVTKAIKISEENYHWLIHYAADIQKESNKPVSIDAALTTLRSSSIAHLRGTWKMGDQEAEKIISDIHKGWKNWKLSA